MEKWAAPQRSFLAHRAVSQERKRAGTATAAAARALCLPLSWLRKKTRKANEGLRPVTDDAQTIFVPGDY